jgi:hypothetical protein
MVDKMKLKPNELVPMNKEEFRVWQDYVLQYNHDNNDNPDMQIAYEVRWKDDDYKVKLLNIGLYKEGQE